MFISRRLLAVIVFLLMVSMPAHADEPPWPFPVGQAIVLEEYPPGSEGGPSGVWNVIVTESRVWWEINYGVPGLPHTVLVRHDLLTGQEQEFSFDYRIRQFVVTADDANAFYTTWDASGCSQELDCLFHFDVLEENTRLVWQSEPMWNPDIDDCWLVWTELHPYRARLMNWQEDSEPTALDPGFGDDPRISYPWTAWKALGEEGLFPRAQNLETGQTINVDIAPEVMGRYLDVDDGLLVYSVGEYLLTHLYLLNLNDPNSEPTQISWDNGAEKPRIHNELVVWDYKDGATGRSAIQGRDLETGLTFDIGVRGGMHSYDVRNHIVAWADRTYYPEAQVFIMLTRPYPLQGDMNGDNCVDVTDIALVSSHLGAVEGDPEYDRGWDLNWDGVVNDVDIMLVDKHRGEGCAAPTPVGGVIVPVNKFELLLPWLCVGLVVLLAGGVLMIRHIP